MEDYGMIKGGSKKLEEGENGPLYNSPKGRFPQSQSGVMRWIVGRFM